MFQSKIVILFFIFIKISFSQESQIDTLYVYEDVIVRDTVFVYEKIKVQDTITVGSLKVSEEKKETFEDFTVDDIESQQSQENKSKLYWLGVRLRLMGDEVLQHETVFNSGRIRDDLFLFDTTVKSWSVGAKMHSGLEQNTFFNSLSFPNKTLLGFGVWSRKQVFESNFSFSLGVDGLFYAKKSINDVEIDNINFNTYFYTDSGTPFLMRYIKSNSYQVQVPLQVCYNYRKCMLSMGGYASFSNYLIGVFNSNKIQDFKSEVIQIGYVGEFQYQLLKHFSVGLIGSYGGFENLVFKNSVGESFMSINSFKEAKGLVQVVYTL